MNPGRNGHNRPNLAPAELQRYGLAVSENRHSPGQRSQHRNEYSSFFLAIAGHGRWECGGRQYLLGPDTICHIPAGQSYWEETPPGAPAVTYALHYRPTLLNGQVRAQLDAIGVVAFDLSNTTSNQCQLIRSIFQEMLFEQDARQEGWEVMLKSRLQELCIRALRLARRRNRNDVPVCDPGSDSKERVARYALRLRSEFTRQETLVEAARSVGLSRRHFTELFRSVTGQSWGRYILALRLQHAAGLLVQTSRAVTAVAFESGFQDISHFHHCFKCAYGCSPLNYREQHQVRTTSPADNSASPARQQAVSASFKFRGMKGWFWSPEQYLEEIPKLPEMKLNFLMNCYGSMSSNRNGDSLRNEWWQPMPTERKEAFRKIMRSCADHNITFCFALHPQQGSPRPLRLKDKDDLSALCQHYLWAQQQGVRWFSLCLDGTTWGPGGLVECAGLHAELVNDVLARLHPGDPQAELIFCPAISWGDATSPEHYAYLNVLGREMHPAVRIFWNGDAIVTPRVTRVAAESYRRVVAHRLFLWDNYPVNDGNPTLHLGPLSGRASDLCEVVDGYLCNSMCPQNQISRLPISTCGDYASAPAKYNPARAITDAIRRFGQTETQRKALEDLVEAYPGFIVVGGGTGTNPVRSKFGALLAGTNSRETAQAYLAQVENLHKRLAASFPSQFAATRKTVAGDIRWMKLQLGA